MEANEELKMLIVRKKAFFKLAQFSFHSLEYRRDFVPTNVFLKRLSDHRVDVFTFIDRKWASKTPLVPEKSWTETEDNIGLLAVKTYDEWLALIGKKTRNMVRKAEKSGVKTDIVKPNEKLVEGIWKMYNESAIRQERAFPYYGISMENVRGMVYYDPASIFIGSILDDELIGFIYLAIGDSIAVIEQILAFQKHSDKALNNALIAKAVQVCASRQIEWLMYGRIGNHPSLDKFKENNGFSKFSFPRYYVTLTKRGRIAIALGLHKELKDSLPLAIKLPLIPLFNLISRSRQRLRLALRSRPSNQQNNS